MSVEQEVYSVWFALTRANIETHAPASSAALQLRRTAGLIQYPRGKSAMVFFTYAADDAQKVLLSSFSRELEEPGSSGQGSLLFRFLQTKNAAQNLADRLERFRTTMGADPILHRS